MKIVESRWYAETREPTVELRSRLKGLGLLDLLASYGTDAQRTAAIRFDLPLLPTELRTAVELLTLGDRVEAAAAEKILSADLITGLKHIGIVRDVNGCVDLDGLRLVHHCGVVAFCERPHVAAKLYYGNDSLALGRLLFPARGHVLDLCAGVGTQSLLSALTADTVVAVEQQPSVASLFTVNAILNSVEARIDLRLGDLEEPVRGVRFDQICCNPPLLPIPDRLAFPLVGNGGPDGLAIVKRVVGALPELLRDGGRCHMVATLLGSSEGPDVSALRCLAEQGSLDVLLILPCREPLRPEAPMLEGLTLTASDYGGIEPALARTAFLESFASRGADFLYSALMVIRRTPAGGHSKIETTQHYVRGDAFWTM